MRRRASAARASAPKGGRQAGEQAREDSPQGRLAVRVRAVVHGQHGERHPRAAADEQYHLVVQQPCRVAPAALEVEPLAARRDLADAPAVSRRDAAQQPHCIAAMPSGDEPVDVQEEAGLFPAVMSVAPQTGLGAKCVILT